MTRVCLAVTDVVSFNVLCKGQLEFLRDSGGYDLTLILSLVLHLRQCCWCRWRLFLPVKE